MLEQTFWNYFMASGDPGIYTQYREYHEARMRREEQLHGGEHQDPGNYRKRSANGGTGQTAGDSMRG